MEYNGNMEWTDYKNTPALLELLLIASSPDWDCTDTTTDSITNQANDAYCNQVAWLDGAPGSLYLYDQIGNLARQSKVESSVQIVESAVLCVVILYLSPYSISGCHQREQRLYDKTHKYFHLPHIANDVYTIVSDRWFCPTQGIPFSYQKKLRLFHS